MWVHMKRAMFESPREVCCSVRVGRGDPKSVWWHDQILKVYDVGDELLNGIKSMFQDQYWCETNMYHLPMAFQCIYG